MMDPESSVNEPTTQGSRRFLYAISFLVVLLLGIGGLFLWLSGAGRTVIFSAVGTGLLSSALFAAAYTFLSDLEMRERMHEEIGAVTRSVLTEVHNINTEFAPSNMYAASNKFQPHFHAHIAQDLESSRFYSFRGLTGRWIPLRIETYGRRLETVRLIICDPRAEDSHLIAAMNPDSYKKYEGMTDRQIASTLREDIYSTVTRLFLKARHGCDVHIAYESGPAVMRIELFDHAVYKAIFHAQYTEHRFPSTARFRRNTSPYEEASVVFRRDFRASGTTRLFRREDDRSALVEHLEELGCNEVSDDRITELNDKYEKFAKAISPNIDSSPRDTQREM